MFTRTALCRARIVTGVILLAGAIVLGFAGGIPSDASAQAVGLRSARATQVSFATASAAKISAHLTSSVFTSSQTGSVKLIYRFSKPSKHFSYLLTFKKGSKWQTVKSVKKKG